MKKFFKWLIIIFIIILSIIIYARYLGTMGLITKEYAIIDKNIPTGFDGIKIVHFSDIHYKRAITQSKLEDIVKEINLINPDIVIFTGDLIDKDYILQDKDINDLINIFKSINTKYGKYAISGNHDINVLDKVTKIYDESNFKYLDNDYDIIYNKNNEKIFISGISSANYNLENTDKINNYLKENNNISYKIFLIHEPDITDNIINNYNVNLILAGHSHNGQVRLPIIGAIYTPNGAKKYYDNYYQIDETNLYISSGIGVSSFNYRLLNKPSINFYRLNN